MYIQCTKKLLDRLARPYEKLSNPPEPQFCWHASYFEYRGVEFVLMMNNYTGADLFFEVTSFQDVEKKFFEELQRNMKEAGRPQKDISRYIKEAGPISFGPTGNRSQVAKLNGFTRQFKAFAIKALDLLDTMGEMKELDDFPADLEAVADELFETMKQNIVPPKPKRKAKPKPKATPASAETLMIALDVTLKLLGDTNVSRSFLLPIDIPFSALHMILQIGFGWFDQSPHEFDFSDHGFKIRLNTDNARKILDFPGMHDEEETLLSDLLPSIKQFSYIYDLDKHWEHIIKVGDIGYAVGGPRVTCTAGEGIAPLEACEGPFGFETFLKAYYDPSHEDYDFVHSFVDEFDLERLNGELGRLEFTAQPL